jgi:hypothetical protein
MPRVHPRERSIGHEHDRCGELGPSTVRARGSHGASDGCIRDEARHSVPRDLDAGARARRTSAG